MLQTGEPREIDPRMISGPARRANRTYVVVHERIGVQRDPVAQKRKPVGEVEGSQARAGIIWRRLLGAAHVLEAEKAVQERVQGDRRMALSAPDRQSVETELQIPRGLETDLLHVDPRVVRVRVTFQASDEEVVAERPRNS